MFGGGSTTFGSTPSTGFGLSQNKPVGTATPSFGAGFGAATTCKYWFTIIL